MVHNDGPDRYYDMDYTTAFEARFRPLEQIADYDPHYIDPEYGVDPYWDISLYDQQNLQFKCDDYPPTDDEDVPEVQDNNLTRALIELWQPNSEITNEQEMEDPIIENGPQSEPSLLDESAFLHVLITKEREPAYVHLSTNLGHNYKKRMLYFPMDFWGTNHRRLHRHWSLI